MTEIKFEDALKKLEEIVKEIEGGELSLDESLKQYEEGVKLSRFCVKKLDEAEKKIELLQKGLDGKITKKKFKPSDAPESEPSQNAQGKKQDEELLF